MINGMTAGGLLCRGRAEVLFIQLSKSLPAMIVTVSSPEERVRGIWTEHEAIVICELEPGRDPDAQIIHQRAERF